MDGRKWKKIGEKEAEGKEPAATKEEEEAKEQQQEPAAAKEKQQDDDERYDTVAKIKLVHERKRVKEFRVTGNLNNPNTKMIWPTSHHTLR